MKSQKKKNYVHLSIIGVLIVIFLGLIFVSTSKTGIETKYSFKDKVEVSSLPQYDSNFLVGEVEISNSAFIPKRVFLDKYVLCSFSEYSGDKTYTVNFKGKTKRDYYDPFSSRSSEFVEVSSVESIKLEMVPSIYSYDLREIMFKENVTSIELPLYLFKVEEDEYYYNYCTGKIKEDALKSIVLDIDFSDLAVKDEEKYY